MVDGPRYQGTQITEPPTFSGQHGRAWRLTLAPMGERSTPEQDATVGAFLVQEHGAHAFWDHWMLSIVHLRPIAGTPPPNKQFMEATHEFMILALNPEQPLPQSLHIDRDWKMSWLTPIDVVEQFAVGDDVLADRILELSAEAIVHGWMSPDQDWRAAWKQSVAKTSAHYRDGTHGVERH